MLKKSDLAKQFEMVVQQEIKNYQDSLNFVLQSINQLKDSVEDVRQQSLENHAMLHSVQVNLLGQLKDAQECYAQLSRKFDIAMSDQRKINERNSLELRDVTNAVIKKISIDSNFQLKSENLMQSVNTVRLENQKEIKNLNQFCSDLMIRFRKEILKTKQDILASPSKADEIKNEMDEKIARHTVDVDGIMREIKVIKKENFIFQKNLENIYTQIEGLKNPSRG